MLWWMRNEEARPGMKEVKDVIERSRISGLYSIIILSHYHISKLFL